MDWKDNPAYPPEVSERLKEVEAIAQRNLAEINARLPTQRVSWGRKLNSLMKSRDPVWVRLRALYQVVDEETSFFGENVACRRGCAHCCHLGVGLSEPEAEMLGAAIKRRPRKAPNTDLSQFDYGYHNPCTFLKNGECSIYAHRPLACRIYFSVDKDPLLCQLIPPSTPPVPGVDTTEFLHVYTVICGGAKIADIRQYFPPASGESLNPVGTARQTGGGVAIPASGIPRARNRS